MGLRSSCKSIDTWCVCAVAALWAKKCTCVAPCVSFIAWLHLIKGFELVLMPMDQPRHGSGGKHKAQQAWEGDVA